MRVALYSPGMVGLGHLRRNLLLARRFAAARPDAALLVLAEAREVGAFAIPDTVDCVSLPALRKDADGSCAPRRMPVDLGTVLRLRAAVLEAALQQFAPDVLVVDHLPRGALGELARVLPRLRRAGCKMVLGLRDILEDPEVVRAEWSTSGHVRMIRDLYDAVWFYGDPMVFDPLAEYALTAEVRARARCLGYLDPIGSVGPPDAEDADRLAAAQLSGDRAILCQVGGGQDGYRLAAAFIDADLPAGAEGVLLTGAFMPRPQRETLVRRALARPRPVRVLGLIPEPVELVRRAERLVTMGGYNSLTDVIALEKRALVVPRGPPQREQIIRATRLERLGVVDVLQPQALSSAALTRWLAAPTEFRPVSREAIDLGGLDRAATALDELLALGSGAPSEPPPAGLARTTATVMA